MSFSLDVGELLEQKTDGEGAGWITDSHISVLCGTRVHVACCLQVRFTDCEKGSSIYTSCGQGFEDLVNLCQSFGLVFVTFLTECLFWA